MSNVLKLKRTQPVQGHPVTVFFETDGGTEHGRITLPFDTWLKFNKILQLGISQNATLKYYDLKITVEGLDLNKVQEEKHGVGKVFAPWIENQEQDPEAAELQPALEQAKQDEQQEKVIRSLGVKVGE